MTLEEFCRKLSKLSSLDNAKKAISLLWFLDNESPDIEKKASDLATILRDNGLANPNSSQLATRISSSGYVFKRQGYLRLKEQKKDDIKSWLEPILDGVPTEVDINSQYLHEQVWKNTRGYIEKVCKQLNGCFFHTYFDGASVLMRRLVETLIIECYEHLNRQNEIKGDDGHYLMLSGLVDKAVNKSGLNLGRETKEILKEIKKNGDRSAHNRKYNARKADLTKVQSGFRVAVEELLHTADLISKK